MKHIKNYLFDEQVKAFIRIIDFIYNNKDKKFFILNGFAGTGKSHLLSFINTYLLHNQKFNFFCCSLTGKAASVLANRGITNSGTIHSFLYYPTYINDRLTWIKRKGQAEDTIIFVDEYYFLNKTLIDDLLDSTSNKVVFIGDDNQLPSIDGSGFSDSVVPDFRLTDNHRAVENSGIIELSDTLRIKGVLNKNIQYTKNDVKFDSYSSLNSGFYLENNFDVVLCGTNRTKERINRNIRRSKGFRSEYPQKDDIIINLVNHYSTTSTEGIIKTFNGDRFKVLESSVYKNGNFIKLFLKGIDGNTSLKTINFSKDKWEDWQDNIKIKKDDKYSKEGAYSWGYALTVHKAQGSEFNNVLFIDEDVSGFVNRKKFRYTGITRAKEKLTIIS